MPTVGIHATRSSNWIPPPGSRPSHTATTSARSTALTATHAPVNTRRGAVAGTSSSAAATTAGRNTISDSTSSPHDDHDEGQDGERGGRLGVVLVDLPGLRAAGEPA